MKSIVIVRDCKQSELKVLQELVQELYVTDAGPSPEIPDVALTYRSLKAKPDKGRLVVFERRGNLVGYAILIFFFSNEFAGDIVDIDEILVTESARGHGVGRAFFAWLKATYKKAVGWSLQVRPTNRKARKLYESQGFLVSTNLHMYDIFSWHEPEVTSSERAEKSELTRRRMTAKKSTTSRSLKASEAAQASSGSKAKTVKPASSRSKPTAGKPTRNRSAKPAARKLTQTRSVKPAGSKPVRARSAKKTVSKTVQAGAKKPARAGSVKSSTRKKK